MPTPLPVAALLERVPLFKKKTYINSCSQGALSFDVRRAYEDYLCDWDERGAPWEYWVEMLEKIRAAITPRTRAIVTVSPNNPTGAVYPESALREVNQLCRDQGVYHIHDEAYEYFVYHNGKHFSPGSIDGAAGHTISLFSLSKAYGFASWRIGAMVIPEVLLESVRKIQDTILICAPVISQFAAIGALEAGAAYCREKLRDITEIRDVVRRELSSLGDRCELPPADGAFYFLLRVQTELPPMRIVERLIQEHRVAVIPGTAFGLTDGCYLRVAYGALQRDQA